MSLNPKQELFCRKLIECAYNQTEAYCQAYPDSTRDAARASASELLTNPSTIERIHELQDEHAKKDFHNAQWVKHQFVELVRSCLIENDNTGANSALDKLAKITGAYEADNEQQRNKTPDNVTVTLESTDKSPSEVSEPIPDK